MKCTILKSFPYSTDGVTHRALEVDAQEDIADRMVPGLEGEGYVRRVSGEPAQVVTVSNADVTKVQTVLEEQRASVRKTRRGNRG